ncbi:MAG: lipoprotein, partial [Pseudomonas sp.]
MRHFILGALALVLLAGCATPPPPEPGSAASKIVVMGKFKGIAVGAIRVARENG